MRWEKARLGDVCELVYGKSLKKENRVETGRHPVFGSSGIVGYHDKYLSEGPTIVVGRKGSIGTVFFSEVPCWTIDTAYYLQPDKRFYPRFLYYQLRTLRLTELDKSAAIPGLSRGDAYDKTIVIPPLPIQKQIADTLDKADALRRKDQELLQKYDELAQSIFYEMFGDPVRNERGWNVSKLKEVTEFVQIGPFGSLLHAEDYISGGTPLVNPSHIKQGKIVPDVNLTVNEEKLKELENYRLSSGDIVMGRRGEMGRCAVVTENEDGWLCGTGSLFIRSKEVLNSQILVMFLSHPSMKSVLKKSSLGTTMSNLNQTIVSNLEVIVPPFAVQKQYIELLNSLKSQYSILQMNITWSNQLFRTLLGQSFN